MLTDIPRKTALGSLTRPFLCQVPLPHPSPQEESGNLGLEASSSIRFPGFYVISSRAQVLTEVTMASIQTGRCPPVPTDAWGSLPCRGASWPPGAHDHLTVIKQVSGSRTLSPDLCGHLEEEGWVLPAHPAPKWGDVNTAHWEASMSRQPPSGPHSWTASPLRLVGTMHDSC